jgi:hypothetical protein
MLFSQNCAHKAVPFSCCETSDGYQARDIKVHDGYQARDIKVQDVTDPQEEEDSVAVISPVIKNEYVVSCISVLYCGLRTNIPKGL